MTGQDDASPAVTVLRRRVVAANGKWRVLFDRIADGAGNQVDDYLVLQPIASHGPHNVTGVTVLPILGDGIVLIRNYRHPLDVQGWEAVRGFVDEGETPVEAAVRELAEETGLVARSDGLIPLGFAMPEPSTIAGRAALFAAPDCRPGGAHDNTEAGLGPWQAHSREAIAALLRRFAIEDATTEIVLRRYLSL